MSKTTNQNMTHWTKEPIAGSHDKPGNRTKLKNKKHENMSMKQTQNQRDIYNVIFSYDGKARTKFEK